MKMGLGSRVGLTALAMAMLAPVGPARADETINYAYDGRGRLVKVSRTGTVNNGASACYDFDKADNRKKVVTARTYDCAGTPPSFSISDASTTEGGALSFTVSRSGSAGATVTIDFATSNGTAAAGSDYNAVSGTLTFLATDPSKTITVTTIDDAAVEGSEALSVNLSNVVGNATISDASGSGTILDNDSAPVCGGVSFTIVSTGAVTEGGASGFTVTKSGSTTGSCSVAYATSNGTAAASSDYTAASGTLTFSSVQTSLDFTVPTTDDATVESAETFVATLSSPSSGATLGSPGSATATINDNDSGGGGTACSGVSFSVNDTAQDEGSPIVFTVTKSGSTASSCSVNYATADGTAIAPNDYGPVSGTLTFGPSETTKTVSTNLPTLGPGEGTEYMYLNLSGAGGGATISDSQGKGTIYNYTIVIEPCYENGIRVPCP